MDTIGEIRINSLVILFNGLLGRLVKTYIHQFCADIGCRLEDLSNMMVSEDGWWERERERERECVCVCVKGIQDYNTFIFLSSSLIGCHFHMALCHI